jgi:hypothetical protein
MPNRGSPLRPSVSLRRRLLGGISLLYIALALSDQAQAADMPVKAPKAQPFLERFYFSVEGTYLFNGSPSNLDFDPSFNFPLQLISPLRPGRNGGRAEIAFGALIDPTWDWRVAVSAAWLRSNSVAVTTPFAESAAASDKLRYQTFDGEIGARTSGPGAVLRAFAGVRVLHAKNEINYTFDDGFKLGNFDHNTELWGVGPRAGFEATVPLNATPAFVNLSGSASAIFSRRSHDFNFSVVGFGDERGSANLDRSLTVYNAEATAALGYRFSALSSIQVGYRVQQWWNLVPQVSQADRNGNFVSGESDVLTHGPFAKLTVGLP